MERPRPRSSRLGPSLLTRRPCRVRPDGGVGRGFSRAPPAEGGPGFGGGGRRAGIDEGIAPPCSRVEPDDASGAETPRSPRATDGPPDTAGEAHHPADDGTA